MWASRWLLGQWPPWGWIVYDLNITCFQHTPSVESSRKYFFTHKRSQFPTLALFQSCVPLSLSLSLSLSLCFEKKKKKNVKGSVISESASHNSNDGPPGYCEKDLQIPGFQTILNEKMVDEWEIHVYKYDTIHFTDFSLYLIILSSELITWKSQ